jgi:hypothetical protein
MTIYRVPVNISFTGVGSPGANVWHVRAGLTPGSTAADLQSAVDSIHAFYDALILGGGGLGAPFAAGTVFTLGNVTDVATQQLKTPSWTAQTIGATGNDAPPACQVCVAWRTTVAARRGQGRTFLGPLNNGVVETDGSIKAQVRTNVLAAAQALITRNLPDNGWAVGIWGLDVAGGDRKAPRVLRDITGRTVGTQFAVLRSRRD